MSVLFSDRHGHNHSLRVHPRSTRGKTTGQGTHTWQLTIILLQLFNADVHINWKTHHFHNVFEVWGVCTTCIALLFRQLNVLVKTSVFSNKLKQGRLNMREIFSTSDQLLFQLQQKVLHTLTLITCCTMLWLQCKTSSGGSAWFVSFILHRAWTSDSHKHIVSVRVMKQWRIRNRESQRAVGWWEWVNFAGRCKTKFYISD